MSRWFFTGMAIALALICVLVVNQLVRSPVEGRKALLDEQIAGARHVEAGGDDAPQRPYDEYQRIVGERASLWTPLIGLPEAPEQPPDWEQLLKGVAPTGAQIGEPPDVKIKLTLGPNDRRGDWVEKGMVVNGATITDITEDEVVFTIVKNGKTYAHKLRR